MALLVWCFADHSRSRESIRCQKYFFRVYISIVPLIIPVSRHGMTGYDSLVRFPRNSRVLALIFHQTTSTAFLVFNFLFFPKRLNPFFFFFFPFFLKKKRKKVLKVNSDEITATRVFHFHTDYVACV